MEDLGIWVGVFIVLALYFIPSWIAAAKNHHQFTAIFWVNLLVGWTAVGWFIAFIWSLTAVNRDLQADSKMPCPYCAEPIMRAAKVCKHCGRDIEPNRPIKKHQAPPATISVPTPSKVARAEAYGIKKVRGQWMFEGRPFSSLDVALKYADARVKTDTAT